MSGQLVPMVAGLASLVLFANVVLCGARAVIGPSPFDRVMALEAVTFNLSGAVVLAGLTIGTGAFMDFLLVVALLGFISTVAMMAYLEGHRGA